MPGCGLHCQVQDCNLHEWFHYCDILALMDGDILVQGLIELIEYSYQQNASSSSEVYLERTSKSSVLALEQFGMGDRPGSFLRCT
jgi:hypothetical protein